MKNYKYLLLVSTCLLFNNNSQASELDLTFNSTPSSFGIHAPDTHTPVELKPMLISDIGVKLASVCALGSGGCDGLGFNISNNDINLDNNTLCRDEGFVTSCPSGYIIDTSQTCPYNGSFFKCRVCSHTCNSGSLAYCSSDQVETGSSRNDCNETCYTCRAKTCEEGGYASSITSCQKANAVSFAGKTCYSGVSSKTCTDGGYVASIPTNQVGQSTNFCGNTCYYNLRTPACSEGGHRDNIPVNQVCTTTPYYGQNCYSGCYTPTCSAGGYVSACPANQVGTSVNYYGQNCYSGCNQPTCSAGGYVSACPANQVGTSVNYYGQNCYSGCNQPTCSAGGYVDACPANQVGSSVSYYGRTCYYNCYQPSCSEGGYLASVPGGQNCSSTSYYGRTCYKDCKDNCVENCSGYDLYRCPDNSVCSTCQTGSASSCSTKYKFSKCNAGYTRGTIYYPRESCETCEKFCEDVNSGNYSSACLLECQRGFE